MKIGLIQMEVLPGEVELNRDKALALMGQAVEQGCRLVVLPELWTTGYALNNIEELSESTQGETLAALRAFAREQAVEVITGSIPIKDDGKVYNSAFALDPCGHIRSSYRKIHLFSLMGEERFFQPGEQTALFEMSFGKAAMIICYDLRFPELARTLAVNGARALFVLAEWPSLRGEHWRILNIARAIENQMFVFAVNCVGRHKQNIFYGHSLAIDPWGRILAEGDDREAVLTAEIEWTMAADVRSKMPIFADRRPDVYIC